MPTVTFQQGIDSYTGAESCQFNSGRRQDPSITSHYYRYDGYASRYSNLEYFDIGDTSSWGAVTSATLSLSVVGGSVFTSADIYLRRITDPDSLGKWALAASAGFRVGANFESRDDLGVSDTKWQNSDPSTPDDLGVDYFEPILISVVSSEKFIPLGSESVGDTFDIDVTTDIEGFRAGTFPNQGWATWHDATANIQNFIGSSNNITVAYRPLLTVTYDTAGGGTIVPMRRRQMMRS